MARRIPDETLQAIRDRISIVEVISAYVNLKRQGRNHIGLCPFHGEKTPSFTVSDERGLYHCFGCGESGTVFSFVMKMERIEFLDAVTQLAARAGVALPAADGDDPAARRREQLYAANAHAERFFREALASAAGAGARRYLEQRGLNAATIDRYALGFAPATGTALVGSLERQKVAREVALQAGLLGRRDDGRVYDRFRGRVMFPIRDRRGRTIAFGGRSLGDEQPKYLNSPETPLFHKGEGLYGIAEARDAIRSQARAVLVEGYMDALVLAQEGVPYVVATLGTALTAAQLRVLQPLGGEDMAVFFFFDGDRAGRQAAVRAFAICAEAGVWGRAAFLPEGFDPDSYTRQHGAAATLALLDAAPSLVDFYFDTLLPPGATLPQRTRVADAVKVILGRVGNDVQLAVLARQAAARLGLSEELFRRARGGAPSAPPARATTPKAWPVEERLLVELMAADRVVAELVAERGTLARFRTPELADAGERLVQAWQSGRPLGEVVEQLPPALAARLTAVALEQGPLGDAAERLHGAEDCARRIEEQSARAERQALASELRSAESRGDDTWRSKLADLNSVVRRREGGAG
ncbi:MAG TPA: DNA primase [Candidatus Dormibacteraeota bacterium]|nr:DNA primase [Candidatus Dormibacteraeota bacterium]